MRTTAVLGALAALLRSSIAILVVQGSPCDQSCGNVLSATHSNDLVCNETQYASTSAGVVFEACTRCELKSNYTADGQTDLQWMAYNIRFAISYCLFGDYGNPAWVDNPCVTSTACGPLKSAFEWNNLTTAGGAYDYCQAGWSQVQAGKCSDCLLGGSMHYLNNFVVMLNATCDQMPAPGKTISVAGDPFSTIPMNVTSPTATPLYSYNPAKTAVSVGARAGIAAAGIIVILAVTGCCIVWNGKRRRRRFLQELEKRHADVAGWPHPRTRHGGTDMLETPASQRPLRGWDDTPASAATEASTDPGLGRHFSPYSSTYNSPVSAADGPAMKNWPTLSPQKLTQVQIDELAYMQAQDDMIRRQQQEEEQQQAQFHSQQHQWPSSAQEKLMQTQHEREQQALAKVGIGLALGGDEASLRSRPSDQQLGLDTASLRSKPSDPQFWGNNNPYGGDVGGPPYHRTTATYRTTAGSSSAASSPVNGKNHGAGGSDDDYDEEAYEMHEVPSSGGGSSDRSAPPPQQYRMPAAPQAPVLHHPGYGRHPSLRRTGTGGSSRAGALTEDDARRGNAV